MGMVVVVVVIALFVLLVEDLPEFLLDLLLDEDLLDLPCFGLECFLPLFLFFLWLFAKLNMFPGFLFGLDFFVPTFFVLLCFLP
jgi:hypothetical protein